MNVREIFETMEYGPAAESSSEAVKWLDDRDRQFGHYIDGAFTEPASGKRFATINPATETELAQIASGNDEDIDAAVAAARKAQPGWASLKGSARARYLYALARHLQKNQRLFAVLESLDNGKTIRESRDIDVPLAIRHFYYHAGWASLQEEELSRYEPLGVAGQIIPWNFPLLMLAWKIAPAIALGNTIVLKPAEQTPLTALAFASICKEIGLPNGVVNIVTGDGSAGAALVNHPGVDKIAFTGSTEVGKIIRKSTAGTNKSLTLELGGKSPFIVFDDADLDSAVEGVVDSIWFNQGQVCCAGSRLLMQEGIADTFIRKLKARLETLRLGNPLEKNIDMGPIVSREQHSQISQMVDRACDDGCGLIQSAQELPESGFYYPATLLTGVEPSHEIAQKEIFGPVLVSMTFRTPDEAVLLANHTRYGLAASVWSENVNLVLDIAPKLQAGVVWTNSAIQFDAAAGFGGVKESGFGREGGREGLFAYLKPKATAPGKAPHPAKSAKANKVAKQAEDGVDRTAKNYVGGKQARPDGGYVMPVFGPGETTVGHVGLGNRKDIRNAVEAARNMTSWTQMTAHGRAQVLYYMAENLSARRAEFSSRITAITGNKKADEEVDTAIDLLFLYAGWADKYDGSTRSVPAPGVVLQMNEPIGVVGILCPHDRPLAGFVERIAPALALGNRVVAIPSETAPLSATDFYQVLETSDLPAGALNIVTGRNAELGPVMAAHNDVDMLWYSQTQDNCEELERQSIGNLKRLWKMPDGKIPTESILANASQSKTIWIPYGE